MVQATHTTPIQFPTDCEYSIDNGGVWTALSANIEVTITSATLRVRSVNVTSDVKPFIDTLKASGSSIDSINIKQAKSVTSCDSLFSTMSVGSIRLANLPVCTILSSAFSSTTANKVIISNTPVVVSVNSLFENANIGLVSDLTMPLSTSFYRAFKNATCNVIGDITSDQTVTLYETFRDSSIKSVPKILTNGVNNMYYFLNTSSVYYTLFSKYNLKLVATPSLMYSANPNRIFDGTQITVTSGVNFLSNNSTVMSSTTKMKYPFSKVIKLSTGGAFHTNAMNTTAFSEITTAEDVNLSTNSFVGSVQWNGWLPTITKLDSFDNTNTQGMTNTLQHGSYKYKSHVVDVNGKLLESTNYKPHEDIPLTNFVDTGKVFVGGKVWYARNGWYAVDDAGSLKLYNDSDVLQQTVVIADPILNVSLNSNATKAIVVSGNDIEPVSAIGTTISQSIANIDMLTGLTIGTRAYASTNISIKGTHRPNDESGLCILYTTYVNDGANNVLTSSAVNVTTSVTSLAITETVVTTLPMDYVHTSGREENEFYLMNKATATKEWYFAK